MTAVLLLPDKSEITLTLITDAQHLEAVAQESGYKDTQIFDHTKLAAINTCPTWGIARYGKHLTLGGQGRSTALDAGTACHKYFHALRLWQLYYNQKDASAYYRAGERLFGREYIEEALKTDQSSDILTNAINFCTPFLHDSGYYDDPNDRMRTLANLEQTCIAYTERRLRNFPDVYISDRHVGIEIPFAIKITRRYSALGRDHEQSWHFTGKMDGLHIGDKGRLIVEENKTVSRGWAGDAWRMKWNVEFQPTGYMVAGALLIGAESLDDLQGTVIGSQIPVPKNIYEATIVEPVTRNHDDIIKWLQWQIYTIDIYNQFKDDLVNTPKHTISCSRFNRPCSMIPFCSASLEDQRSLLEDGSFTEQPWMPLAEEVIE